MAFSCTWDVVFGPQACAGSRGMQGCSSARGVLRPLDALCERVNDGQWGVRGNPEQMEGLPKWWKGLFLCPVLVSSVKSENSNLFALLKDQTFWKWNTDNKWFVKCVFFTYPFWAVYKIRVQLHQTHNTCLPWIPAKSPMVLLPSESCAKPRFCFTSSL